MASSFEVSRSHTTTHHSSLGLLWTSDQSVAETSTWQHTTLTTDKHPCPQWDSNPQSLHASGRRPIIWNSVIKLTVMRRITTFRSTTDRVYDCGPIICIIIKYCNTYHCVTIAYSIRYRNMLHPLVRQIGNYTLPDLHKQYRKYIHKRTKHLLL